MSVAARKYAELKWVGGLTLIIETNLQFVEVDYITSDCAGNCRFSHEILEVTAHAIWSHCYEQSRDD